MKTIMPCLWFDKEAEEAANFYCSIFKDAKLGGITRYGNEGQEVHGGKPGSVLTVEFSLDGRKFLALNGGAHFKVQRGDLFPSAVREPGGGRLLLGEAVGRRAIPSSSAAGSRTGSGSPGRSCPWVLPTLLAHKDRVKADRVMKALLQMRKLDIAALQRAQAG